MKTPAQPLSSFLARAMFLAVLLFSQYALAIHAVEHPFHNSEHACETFHGIPNLEQALLVNGEHPVPFLHGCSQVNFLVPAKPTATARAFLIRAPPSVK